MNLTIILLFAFCLQISARANSQGITLNVKNAPLNKVFREIKRQTGYTFVYTETILEESKKVSIDVKNSSIQETLSICFASQPFTYRIIDKTVVIQPREKTYFNAISTNTLPAPPVEIHGRVVNQQGEHIQKASVLIVGRNIGTATDDEGRFTLTAPDNENIVLEISSVGYQTKRMSVGKRTEINVRLELSVSDLSDVVVVGYGLQKKESVVGAIVQVKGDVLERNGGVPSIGAALTGTLPGVITEATTGQPGEEEPRIYIRGQDTWNNTNHLV